jgi:hypothetical protein
MGFLVIGDLSKAATRILRETSGDEFILVKPGERPLVKSVLKMLEGERKV